MTASSRLLALFPMIVLVAIGCGDDTASPEADHDASSGGPHGDGPASSSTGESPVDDDTTGAAADSSGGGDPSGAPVLDVGGGGDPVDPGECPCVGTGDGVYLVSDAAELYTFDPETLAFEKLGDIACPTNGWLWAMAVDRQGHALLSYFDAASFAIESFTIELQSPAVCEPATVPLPAGHWLGGTGYASASAADPCDDLYVFSVDTTTENEVGGVLGRIDEGEHVLVGSTPYNEVQLTGTGDGRLFGFAGTSSDEGQGSIASLVQFDIDDAQVLTNDVLTELNTDNGLGFAFWGGDVWLFTDGAHDTSIVTRVDYDGDGSTEVVVDETPIRIMGAGVSTCAPFGPAG